VVGAWWVSGGWWMRECTHDGWVLLAGGGYWVVWW
jgi:hypothetical protein